MPSVRRYLLVDLLGPARDDRRMLFPRSVLALAFLAAAPRAQSDAPALARALAGDVIAAAGLPGLSVADALGGVAAAPVPELAALRPSNAPSHHFSAVRAAPK